MTRGRTEHEVNASLEELRRLLETAGGVEAARVIQNRANPDKATYVGSGKAEEIAEFITRGGRMVKYDDGAIWIQKGTPWAQRMGDPDDMIRRIVLSVVVEFLD